MSDAGDHAAGRGELGQGAPGRAAPGRGALFNARCKACWFSAGVLLLVVASFWSLDLQWAAFLGEGAAQSMGRFLAEFWPPDFSAPFVARLLPAAWETLAMSLLGTLLAAALGLALALPASGLGAARVGARGLLNALRAIPELVWAALLLISAGLGPFAGTLALALHTSGVLGRLFADSLENAPPLAADTLRAQGAAPVQVFAYATLPTVLPQLVSYTLYRWENNIRAAAVLGVVGAGGLGQLLAFHMGLFHMPKTASILLAMLALVAVVDSASTLARRRLTQ